MGFRVGAVQMNSRDNKDANVERAVQLIGEAVSRGAELVALPENFNYLGPRDRKSTRLNSSHIPLSRMPSSA